MAKQSVVVGVYAPGFETLSGEILAITDTSVTIKYKVKRSSRYEKRIIPFSEIAIAFGKEGGEGYVTFINQKVSVEEPFEAAYKGIKNGMIQLETEEGPTLVSQKFVEMIENLGTEDRKKKKKKSKEGDEEVSEKKLSKKEKKKLKKMKSKKKSEDEDEDGEDW